MTRKIAWGTLSFIFIIAVVWIGRGLGNDQAEPPAWDEVVTGVWRSKGIPCAYAIVANDKALLVDAPRQANVDRLMNHGAKTIDQVLLTHHHRDTCGRAEDFAKKKIPVLAPKASAEWLLPDGVVKYWKESLPLRNSRTAYLVVPEGIAGIDCSLEDGQKIEWNGWTIQVVSSPGHSRDHVAYVARNGDGPPILFCGDAMSASGKMWSPYTTDWDHWTDLGLKPAGQSLRKLADLKPSLICPAHGKPIKENPSAALIQTAAAVEEVAFLKSFERFSKQRLGNAPDYAFLAKEQKESAGEKPWSQVSPHLWITGNTYVLVSKENAIMVMDPWGKRSVDQIAKLRADQKLGSIELVMFSHAHFDHYDGIYDLPDRDKFQVWTLDEVARPISDPYELRAPFLDARPVKIDRRMKSGHIAEWREFKFRFHHFPGQTFFTMAVETEIDGKKCLFTADNFFHQDQFSGSGGWMGLNRSWPSFYAQSAKLVSSIKPDWVLAEHGGPFVFNAEDFRRRAFWGEAAAKAADALSPSGNHRLDWDPHRIAVEPLVQKAKPGQAVGIRVVSDEPTVRDLTVRIDSRGMFQVSKRKPKVSAGDDMVLVIQPNAKPGFYVFPVDLVERETGADAFFALQIEDR